MTAKLPLILIVDEEDKPIGSAHKREAQEKGLIHRIAQIIVEDPSGRILLQKRATDVELHPGLWDTSVGGHVDAGEGYLAAAKREMLEEIGLKGIELKALGKYQKNAMVDWRHLNRFYKIFKAVVPAETKFNPKPSEVAELRWFTVTEIKQLIVENRDQFTGGVVKAVDLFYS